MQPEDPNILDLSDMPLFFEDIPEESYIPATGPKRIDGLSQPPHDTDNKSKRRKNLPWLGLILLVLLLAGAGSALALRSNHPVITRPVITSRTTTQLASAVTPTTTTKSTIAYVTIVPALSVHSVPIFSSDNVIGAVPNTVAVTVTEQIDQFWVKVDFNGTPGYMSRYYLVDSPDQVSSPVVAAAPTVTTQPADTQAAPASDASVAPSDNGQTVDPGTGQGGTGGTVTDPNTPPPDNSSTGNTSNTNSTQTTTDPGNTTNSSP